MKLHKLRRMRSAVVIVGSVKKTKKHPVLAFGSDSKGGDGYSTLILPDGITVEDTYDEKSLATIELVACAERTESEKVGVCDDYTDDGEAVDISIENYSANYEVTVYEATTAEPVGKPFAVEGEEADCPFIASEDDTKHYADPGEDLNKALSKLVLNK